MYPHRLALIDDDAEYSEYLAQHLRAKGVEVTVYGDSDLLLADERALGFDFYLVDLMLPGLDGVDLVQRLRERSDAGIVVVSGRLAPDVFSRVMTAGADMYLAKPVQFDQVALAIQAVQRRAGRNGVAPQVWRLDRRLRTLIAPDGANVALSDADLTVLDCFIEAAGGTVKRELLSQRLGRIADADEADDGLNAIIYRLRRRIERATPMLVPLQARSRVGYLFRAPLAVV